MLQSLVLKSIIISWTLTLLLIITQLQQLLNFNFKLQFKDFYCNKANIVCFKMIRHYKLILNLHMILVPVHCSCFIMCSSSLIKSCEQSVSKGCKHDLIIMNGGIYESLYNVMLMCSRLKWFRCSRRQKCSWIKRYNQRIINILNCVISVFTFSGTFGGNWSFSPGGSVSDRSPRTAWVTGGSRVFTSAGNFSDSEQINPSTAAISLLLSAHTSLLTVTPPGHLQTDRFYTF